MDIKKELPHLPKAIRVDVSKGESGVLLAQLTEFDVFTEADTLNELWLQVNDLIYTYFDIPKKYHEHIRYIPPKEVQQDLIQIASQPTNKKYKVFNVKPFVNDDETHYSPIV